MRVREVMTSNPDILSVTATLKDAANEMNKKDCGFLPVKDNDGKIIGVVTDRDVILRAIAKGKDPNQTTVKEVMTKDVFVCHEDDDVMDASKKMADKQVRRLVVMDKNEKPCGVFTCGDFAVKVKEPEICGETLKSICKE